MDPAVNAAFSKLRVENLVIQRQVELLSARVDLLVLSIKESPTLKVAPIVPETARTFHCPFRPCTWSGIKCSAASGIHHMHTCVNRPECYHYEIVSRISCFQKHPRLNDASQCCWCGRAMPDYSRDQRSRHRNDCLKVLH
jgi:hypothetical protein